jgi:hypothetical protein
MGGSLVTGIYDRPIVFRIFCIRDPELKHGTGSEARNENAIQAWLISNLKPDKTSPRAFARIFRSANDPPTIQRLGRD